MASVQMLRTLAWYDHAQPATPLGFSVPYMRSREEQLATPHPALSPSVPGSGSRQGGASSGPEAGRGQERKEGAPAFPACGIADDRCVLWHQVESADKLALAAVAAADKAKGDAKLKLKQGTL